MFKYGNQFQQWKIKLYTMLIAISNIKKDRVYPPTIFTRK